MLTITLNMYQTAGVAMLLFVLGRFLTTRIDFLKRCCIPAPVVGGLIFALAHLALYMGGVVQFTFDDNVKNFFMTLFFTSVGYTACFRLLKKGGKKVFTFLLIAIVMVFLQDVLGSVLAAVFHWDMRLGLCTASIPMVGGHGTAGSYGPMMENELGIAGANVLAVAAATYGLVAGSLMGGPTARSIIQRYNLTSTENDSEIMEISDETAEEKAREFAKAPSGITGLETAFSVCNTYLVQPGKLTPMQLVDRMSKAPAEIYGLTDRAVQAGNFARLVLLDWDTEKVYETYKSKGINTPYTGKKLTGSPKAIVTGVKVTE